MKRVLHWLLKIFFAASIGFEVPVLTLTLTLTLTLILTLTLTLTPTL